MKKIKALATAVFLLWVTTAFSQNLDNGLIAKFLFNGNIKDSSTYKHNVTDINGNATTFTTDRFGNAEKALSILTIGFLPIAIQVADNSVFNFSSSELEYSVSCWIYSDKPFARELDNYILCQKAVPSNWLSTNMPDYNLAYGCTSSYWLKRTPNYGWLINTTDLSADASQQYYFRMKYDMTWNHYVITRKDNITTCYMNGDIVLQYQDSERYIEICSDPHLWFLFWPTVGDARLDDAFLYNRKLTDAEVKLLYGDYKNPVTNLSEKEANKTAYKLINNELIFDQSYKKIELMDVSGQKLLTINNVNTLNLDNIQSNVLLVRLYEDNQPTRVIKVIKP